MYEIYHLFRGRSSAQLWIARVTTWNGSLRVASAITEIYTTRFLPRWQNELYHNQPASFQCTTILKIIIRSLFSKRKRWRQRNVNHWLQASIRAWTGLVLLRDYSAWRQKSLWMATKRCVGCIFSAVRFLQQQLRLTIGPEGVSLSGQLSYV